MKQLKWGVDLGGTKIECAVLDGSEPIIRQRIPTEASKGYDHILSQIKKLIELVAVEINERPAKIGFATPGVCDRAIGLMKNCNTVVMNGRPMQEDLQKLLNAEINMANDANCFALAETLYGAGREMPDAEVVFGVIMGTGVGGGLVVNKKIINGANGVAGEWGHNVLDPQGDECYCGKRGCMETIISGVALEKFYKNKSSVALKLGDIIEQYHKGGNAFADETVERLLDNFGKAISMLINVIDPDLIVIGGGVGNIDLLYTEGFERVNQYAFEPGRLRTIIKKPVLGDSAGVFGAAAL